MAGAQLSQVDWDELLDLAHVHGVVGLLATAMDDGTARNLGAPSAFLNVLRRDFEEQLRLHLFLSSELTRLVDLFDDHGVPVVPFKGPVFSHQYYPSPGTRFSWDLDFLLPYERLQEARTLLHADGFRQEEVWSPSRERRELRHNCEWNFDHPDRHLHVELHWRFVPSYIRFGLDERALRGAYDDIVFMGHRLQAIPTEEMLVMMCVHNGAKHQWGTLQSICDVHRMVSSTLELRWGRVKRVAEAYAVERILRVGLNLARAFFPTPIPPPVKRWLRQDQKAKVLAEEYAAQVFATPTPSAVPAQGNTPRVIIRSLALRERLRDRMRYITHAVNLIVQPTEKEEALVDLAPRWRFLYVPLRLARLLRKYLTPPRVEGEQVRW
jgi:hypothetical protein